MKEQEQKKVVKRGKVGITIFLIIVSCVAIGSICYLLHYYHGLYEQEAVYEELRQTEQVEETIVVEETETEAEEQKVYCQQVYDFEELRKDNEDIYAWITIPGTLVDYPVLQSEEDNYYLNRNLDHSKGYPGCIYTNACNAKDFSDYQTVLYGHNMKNDSMFGSLHDFESQDTFLANREIIVYTEEKRLTYEIYAAVKFSDAYITSYYDIYSAAGNERFLEDISKSAEIYADVSHIMDMEITQEDKLITLSTCVANESANRYIVVGCLKEEAYYIQD